MTAPEPMTCRDCGMDTAPCTGQRGCRHAGRWEFYMVGDDVWFAATGHPGWPWPGDPDDILCIGCLEKRLGRSLTAADFTDVPANIPIPWDTPRLAAAKAT